MRMRFIRRKQTEPSASLPFLPCTTVSPRPHAPVTMHTSGKPLSVSSVKMTPLAPTSERTIFCTPADSATATSAKPWCARYEMARLV